MRPVLSPAEAGELDRASQARGIAAATLMENAGREVARAALAVAGGAYGARAVVVCGKGNNGGDGLVAARYLARWGARVTVLMLEAAEDLREPAATNLARLRTETDARVRPFSSSTLARELARADVAIDAIFGTGFRGVPEDEWAEAIRVLNEGEPPVVAVDIPSGVDGATGAVEGEAVFADVTVTFGAPKVGVILLPGAEHAGVVEVVDIGFPPDLIRGELWLMEEEDVAALVPTRPLETHKRETGVVLVVGGSRLMTGAVALVAQAAYRVGAGLVQVAVPSSILPVLQSLVREATFLPLPETPEGTVAPEATEALAERLAGADVLALGPGMTTHGATAAWIRQTVATSPIPVVLDADGLNAFAGRAPELAARRSELVLTPHAGEFARIAGTTSRAVMADRLGQVRALAAETKATVLLKGTRTLVATPEGHVRVNPTGGPYLATGGTGDVLTGAIAGLLARGLPPVDAASAGAFLHGRAGALAAERTGEGTTAVDVLEHLAPALREIHGA
ncbi:Bifunctional NAD(P)H-hydrate repair enzyme Nnr [bacterium HR12]|nr:Bifunctional NAD(P)H-hydrate repair enzyme Nnr [bacterium HR12]